MDLDERAHAENKLQCTIRTQGKKREDEVYEVKYFIKNLSEVDFPGGTFTCHLKIPTLGELTFVNHEWRNIGLIKAGDTISLKPKPIRAIAGPNMFIFVELTPFDSTNKFISVDANGDKLSGGWFMHYLRVRSIEEIISADSLRITAYSLIILIGAQLFDWVLQLWIADIFCSQILTYSGIAFLIVLIIFLFHVRERSRVNPNGV